MNWIHGNIWNLWRRDGTIVIPTNIGWKKDGKNPMGRGLAADAAKELEGKFDLPKFYGDCCKAEMYRVYLPGFRMILLPTKPLNKDKPHLSWRNASEYLMVEAAVSWLRDFTEYIDDPIWVPLLGTGNGGLNVDLVYPLMNTYLMDPRFRGVLYNMKQVEGVP